MWAQQQSQQKNIVFHPSEQPGGPATGIAIASRPTEAAQCGQGSAGAAAVRAATDGDGRGGFNQTTEQVVRPEVWRQADGPSGGMMVEQQLSMPMITTEVNFQVRCDMTEFGQRVALVGSVGELGEWSPERAVLMETKPDIYPIWYVKRRLPRNALIEYKYLIITFREVPQVHRVNSDHQYHTVDHETNSIQSVKTKGMVPVSIKWENLGSSHANRRLNTFDKKIVVLGDEMNSKIVIEEYVEDKSAPATLSRMATFNSGYHHPQAAAWHGAPAGLQMQQPMMFQHGSAHLQNTLKMGAQTTTYQNMGAEHVTDQAHLQTQPTFGTKAASPGPPQFSNGADGLGNQIISQNNIQNQMVIQNVPYPNNETSKNSLNVDTNCKPQNELVTLTMDASQLEKQKSQMLSHNMQNIQLYKQKSSNSTKVAYPSIQIQAQDSEAALTKQLMSAVKFDGNSMISQKYDQGFVNSSQRQESQLADTPGLRNRNLNIEPIQTNKLNENPQSNTLSILHTTPLNQRSIDNIPNSSLKQDDTQGAPQSKTNTDQLNNGNGTAAPPLHLESDLLRQLILPLYNSSQRPKEPENTDAVLSPHPKSQQDQITPRKQLQQQQEGSEANGTETKNVDTNEEASKLLEDFQEIIADGKVVIDPLEPILLVTFLLPYSIERNKNGELEIIKCFHNPSLLYGTLENFMYKKCFNFKWIGLVTTLECMSEQEKQRLNDQFEEMGAYPIFMTVEQTEPYLRFYENILRPLFHNFKDLYNQHNEDLQYWNDFLEVNQRFANKIIDVKNQINRQKGQKSECKSIWVHNNNLIMVPLLVKKQFQKANIGFYFHSPFPSSSHFRIHKFRLKIMQSLLHCDLVGFHLFAYASNFIKTCQRVCGLELEFFKGGAFGINFHGNNVRIRVAHAGIDEQFMKEIISNEAFKNMQKLLRNYMCTLFNDLNKRRKKEGLEVLNDTQKPIIISCIDSLHPISGLVNKLKSFQLFLQKYPNYKDRVVLVQFVGSVVQAFDENHDNYCQINDVRKMREKIHKIVSEIHASFGENCLIYQEKNPSLEKRLSLWTESNIIACGSLKDGLCIQILEYVYCRKMANKFSESAMICSEFAGCNEAMRGVLKYNPFSLVGFEEMLDRALSMSPEQKTANMNAAYGYISLSSMKKWTEGFIKDLKIAHTPNMGTYYLGLAFRSTHKSKNMNRIMSDTHQGFKKLNIEACYQSFLKAKKSCIIVDIEAMPHIKFSKESIPTNEVIELLYGLLSDQQNIVVVMSNESTTTTEGWFKRNKSLNFNSKQFWLVAESGYLFKQGNSKKWHTSTAIEDFSWISKVKYVMSGYAENIEGSYIDARQSSIVWNYKNAEKEHAKIFIHDMYNVIQRTVKGYQVEIIYGDGYLKVKPMQIKKATLIDQLLKKLTKSSKIDWLFYTGNNSDDEAVFEFLKSTKLCNNYFQIDCHKFITVLEKKPSEAEYYIGEDTLRPFLLKFQNAMQYRKKNRSYADFNDVIQGINSDRNLQTKMKLTQIASFGNFNQITSGGLESFQNHTKKSSLRKYIDSNIEQPMGHLSGQPFIPNNSKGGQQHENLSAKNNHHGTGQDCIREQSDEEDDGSAQDYKDQIGGGNLSFSKAKRKFLSLGDTKNPKETQTKEEI